jgi:hypothetical protein
VWSSIDVDSSPTSGALVSINDLGAGTGVLVFSLWTGERVRAVGPAPQHSARVSLHGTFLAVDELRIDSLKVHPGDRDLPTYAGLLLLALLWARPLLPGRARRGRTPGAPPPAGPRTSSAPRR